MEDLDGWLKEGSLCYCVKIMQVVGCGKRDDEVVEMCRVYVACLF